MRPPSTKWLKTAEVDAQQNRADGFIKWRENRFYINRLDAKSILLSRFSFLE